MNQITKNHIDYSSHNIYHITVYKKLMVYEKYIIIMFTIYKLFGKNQYHYFWNTETYKETDKRK